MGFEENSLLTSPAKVLGGGVGLVAFSTAFVHVCFFTTCVRVGAGVGAGVCLLLVRNHERFAKSCLVLVVSIRTPLEEAFVQLAEVGVEFGPHVQMNDHEVFSLTLSEKRKK